MLIYTQKYDSELSAKTTNIDPTNLDKNVKKRPKTLIIPND